MRVSGGRGGWGGGEGRSTVGGRCVERETNCSRSVFLLCRGWSGKGMTVGSCLVP